MNAPARASREKNGELFTSRDPRRRSAPKSLTVTPVVLPGYDDPCRYRRRLKGAIEAEEQSRLLARLDQRVDALLRKSIAQAGFPKVLADHAELEWRRVGFSAGVAHVDRYGVPDHLRSFPRYHVMLTWRDARGHPVEVRGPLCLGGGRYFGLGLFVADLEQRGPDR